MSKVKLYTRSELARELRVAPITVYKYIKALGMYPAGKVKRTSGRTKAGFTEQALELLRAHKESVTVNRRIKLSKARTEVYHDLEHAKEEVRESRIELVVGGVIAFAVCCFVTAVLILFFLK